MPPSLATASRTRVAGSGPVVSAREPGRGAAAASEIRRRGRAPGASATNPSRVRRLRKTRRSRLECTKDRGRRSDELLVPEELPSRAGRVARGCQRREGCIAEDALGLGNQAGQGGELLQGVLSHHG